jgi:CMP-N-acetylneuraminic acid synthetase
LVAHAIENALKSECGRVIVSTNSETIASIAKEFGAETPFLRPPEIATPSASSLSAIIHALLWLRENEGWIPKIVAFAPPTNPFLKYETIREMFSRLESNIKAMSIVSITKPKTHPFRIVRQHPDGTIENGIIAIDGKTINEIERSQDWPVVWEGSPACRMTKAEYFFKLASCGKNLVDFQGKTYSVKSCMGYRISEREAFDIDDASDFKMAEVLAGMR